jgi:2-polyprenyl-6-methoxyphenol hydroxylase-like FAD-dependent oxidoreductase
MAKAVVIGAGPTGLATAMLLAQRDFEVVVLDRDPAPPETVEEAWDGWSRRSVTQFRQVHFLTPGGRAVLEQHLPQVLEAMLAAGAVRYNATGLSAECLPGGAGDVDFSPFETVTSCRRPVMEFGYVTAARAVPSVEIRHETAVVGLTTGTSLAQDVPHVVGVTTAAGDDILADVVIDTSGRRSPMGQLLAAVGARPPEETAEDLGFVYNTRYYRGDALPEVRESVLAPAGSISILTMPGDRGHWSVTVYHSANDKPMRRVRNPDVFDRVVRAHPNHVQWVDGTPESDVLTMASTVNTQRQFVIDGAPIATGIVPIGDAWGFTNPSLGRGITLGLMHAVDVVPVVAEHLGDPMTMAKEWERVTSERAVPWHEATVAFDRIRGPEIEAFRQGLPDPHDPNDLAVAGPRAFESAAHYDPQCLAWFGEMAGCTSLPDQLVARDGVLGRVIEVAMANEPYQTPRPDRATLESLLV